MAIVSSTIEPLMERPFEVTEKLWKPKLRLSAASLQSSQGANRGAPLRVT
jgi:hypothetical protein